MTILSPKEVRRLILVQSKRAGVGHIGSALSIVEIICALYNTILAEQEPNDPERHRFILSKGHAALAIYVAFFLRGWISEKDLNSYCADNTLLGVHPDNEVSQIDFSTGSLGQGLPMAVGSALAARIKKSPRQVFILLSDAECNEGSLWEAVMFAAHHRLGALSAIIDVNKQQALGYTRDVQSPSSLSIRWEGMGWEVTEGDGHDLSCLESWITAGDSSESSPRVFLANTTFGRGVSFMENKVKWHYWPLSQQEFKRAISEVEKS